VARYARRALVRGRPRCLSTRRARWTHRSPGARSLSARSFGAGIVASALASALAGCERRAPRVAARARVSVRPWRRSAGARGASAPLRSSRHRCLDASRSPVAAFDGARGARRALVRAGLVAPRVALARGGVRRGARRSTCARSGGPRCTARRAALGLDGDGVSAGLRDGSARALVCGLPRVAVRTGQRSPRGRFTLRALFRTSPGASSARSRPRLDFRDGLSARASLPRARSVSARRSRRSGGVA
jgi:hypothetical protein